MPPEPVYDEALGEVKKKLNRRMIEARGYEPIHTEVYFLIKSSIYNCNVNNDF